MQIHFFAQALRTRKPDAKALIPQCHQLVEL
jgi:hypothetical protein